MSAMQKARFEAAFEEATSRAGGNMETLARGLLAACLTLAAENELLRAEVVKRASAKKATRERGTVGAPKSPRNPLPESTKQHGRRAFSSYLKPYRKYGMTASEASLFEMLDAGIRASLMSADDFENLRRNLARRVSEAERDST